MVRARFFLRVALGGLLALGAAQRLAAQTVVNFSTFNSSAFLDSTSRMLGWQFTVSTPVTVTQLGWMDWSLDGLAVAHPIGIWDTVGAQLLASATVPAGTAAPLAGAFRVIDLGAPLQLSPGTTYRIAGFDPGSNDPHVWDVALSGYPSIEVTGFTLDPRIVVGAGLAIGSAEGQFTYPAFTIGDSRSVLLGPTFTLVPVPEPATAQLALVGLATLILFSFRMRA